MSFLERLLPVSPVELWFCSSFPQLSKHSRGKVIVNPSSISPDQVDCLRLVSLWTEVLRNATISVGLSCTLKKAIRTKT